MVQQLCNTSIHEVDICVERFWDLETLGITKPDPSIDGHSFIREYQQTYITARFPWKYYPNYLQTACLRKRTRATIKRLSQTPDLLQIYGAIINEQEERGFVEKVSNTAPHHNVHYILHHPVQKDSPTTLIRIVYHCSCKAALYQASLNECLQPGPPLLNDMSAILLRFRTRNYCIVTDIDILLPQPT